MATQYKHLFEKLDANGDPLLEVTYNSSGEIGQMFVYNEYFDRMVPVDIEIFYDMHPTRYADIQGRIFDAIGNGDLYEG